MSGFERFRLLFFGSDSFSIRILKHLLDKQSCESIQVVTSSPCTLLYQFSRRNNLVTHHWPLELPQHDHKPNIGLVASFGHLIDENTVNIFKHGLFNVHPSLLPQFRGSTPVQAAVLHGLQETGCTIMRIPPIPKYDVGEIILQEKMAVKEREYATELMIRLADLGSSLSLKLLGDLDNCLAQARPQLMKGEKSSYAKKIKPEMGEIQFLKETSISIDRKVRAFTGFIDLYTFFFDGRKIKLDSLRDPREVDRYDLDRLALSLFKLNNVIADEILPGTMFFHKTRKLVCIKCSDRKWLAFDNVTPELKAKMHSLDFYNGYLTKIDIKNRRTAI